MKRVLSILAVIPLLAACSGAPAAPAPSLVSPSPSASVTPSPTPTPTPAPTPTPTPTSTSFAIGDEVSLGNASFTVSEYKVLDPKGRHLQSFMVRGCLSPDAEASPFSYVRWTAMGPDGERYEPSDWSYIQPKYGYEMDVKPGECVKGWITFETKEKIARLKYENASGQQFTYVLP